MKKLVSLLILISMVAFAQTKPAAADKKDASKKEMKKENNKKSMKKADRKAKK